MATKGNPFLQRLSFAYKTSRLPWKRHALVGYDLKGNEYWDCPNPLGGRMKRWVQMADKADNDITVFHHNKLPVLWQSWLRHTRDKPPTIAELIQEEKRVAVIQSKAKELEAAWEKRKIELKQLKEEERKETKRLGETADEKGDTSIKGHETRIRGHELTRTGVNRAEFEYIRAFRLWRHFFAGRMESSQYTTIS